MKKLYSNKQTGFSLVEMLVSISILLLVVTGPMTVTSRTSKSSAFATEQVQAFFLAQEGLELAQKIRDDLLLVGGSPWSTFTNTTGVYQRCHDVNTGCGLEWGSGGAIGSVVNCSSGGCRLNYSTTTPSRSVYTYSTSGTPPPSPYTRKITFYNTLDGKAVRVVSTVTWRTGSLVAEQKVEVETYLYNIYDSP